LPDRVELIARIRHHSRGYVAQLQRNEAQQKLAESRRQLADEVAQAAKYVQSLLPAPITEGPVRIKWLFAPSTQLGGDAFGYQWLDDGHLAIYLLDVSGRGVGSSLLAVSILNTLSHRTLPHTDFYNPAAVMRSLNNVFSMERHDKHFFTIWFGVYSVADRKLTFSGGGHPPALLFGGAASSDARLQELQTSGPPIGVTHELPFSNATIHTPTFGRLILYSDGVVEIRQPNGEVSDQEAFNEFIVGAGPCDDLLERTLDRGRRMQGSEVLNDDCSLMQIDFL
jgi:sigma-B regulation protein RsbU (phosphoserine phosphatase)